MTVKDIYEKQNKEKENWALYIFNETGKTLIEYCNSSYSWDNISNAVKFMEVDEITPCCDSIFLKVSFEISEIFFNEEECLNTGFKKLYDDSEKGQIYFRENWIPNNYEGIPEFIGYIYAIIREE